MKPSDKIRQKQKLLYLFVLMVATSLIGVIAYMLIDETPKNSIANQQEQLDIPTDSINPQAILNDKVESQMDLIKNQFLFLEGVILDAKEKEELYLKDNAELRNEIKKLREEVRNSERVSVVQEKIHEDISYKEEPYSPFFEGTLFSQPSPEPRQGIIVKTAEPKRNMVKNVDTNIPSGTTVKAVLVSSVDAPCGIYSSSDPQPVKLQILDDGHLPKCVRVKLKGGVIIGSAYGDLSSERLYIRVERLTQMKPTGDFVDTSITGFVTGEDGKYGVRGTVVDKSFKLVGNAALSGTLAGINNFFQSYASRYTNCGGCFPYCGGGFCNDEGVSTGEFTTGLAIQGGTCGIDNALNQLTDFYIRRAELIKPVLQVNAGRIVDLTFSITTEIGDLHAQEKVEKVRRESRNT